MLAASANKKVTRGFLGARGYVFAALSAAAIAAYFFRDFAVDDALISVRYARNVANGAGWRFDPLAPASDGVTPLPWPVAIAAVAKVAGVTGSTWWTFVAARLAGLVAHAGATVLLVRSVAKHNARWSIWTIVIATLLLGLPTSAYAASGMETPVAELLATAGALAFARPGISAALAGMAATFRPELAPWAMMVGFGYAAGNAQKARGVAFAAAPALACAVIRAMAFGSPGPLAVMAKPSDVEEGVSYVATALAISVSPLLLFAPLALSASASASSASSTPDGVSSRLSVARVLTAAFAVHALVVVLVGGDWMPFARLFAPVLPASLFAFVLLAPHASQLWTNVRAVVALSLAAAGVYAGRGYLHLLPQRLALAEAARPLLAHARRVAAVDIGWVTLATDADVVDLAGLTDPNIAALPGGHTSKRVDAQLLLNRAPDYVLLYTDGGASSATTPWSAFHYPRVVEARLVADERFTKRFEPVGFLPIGSSAYVVLRLVSP